MKELMKKRLKMASSSSPVFRILMKRIRNYIQDVFITNQKEPRQELPTHNYIKPIEPSIREVIFDFDALAKRNFAALGSCYDDLLKKLEAES